jgi:hypothetical protein
MNVLVDAAIDELTSVALFGLERQPLPYTLTDTGLVAIAIVDRYGNPDLVLVTLKEFIDEFLNSEYIEDDVWNSAWFYDPLLDDFLAATMWWWNADEDEEHAEIA